LGILGDRFFLWQFQGRMSESQIYLIRHGETEWAISGRHTGRTDIPLTQRGREQAIHLLPIFEDVSFEVILSSPLQRARQTAEIAGLGSRLEICDDLMEWDYGDYEGLTTQEIRLQVPGWTVWTHLCPNGEPGEAVSQRANRVIERMVQASGNVALFAHGHFLRVLASRWIEQSYDFGRYLQLGTSTLSILGLDRGSPVIRTWNGPLLTAACAVPWRHPVGP
jgi:broad specificity phosphatase PhoE